MRGQRVSRINSCLLLDQMLVHENNNPNYETVEVLSGGATGSLERNLPIEI